MEYLKLKRGVTEEEAREHPSIGHVYMCPKCKVGHTLTHLSSNKVKCNLCGGEYPKP